MTISRRKALFGTSVAFAAVGGRHVAAQEADILAQRLEFEPAFEGAALALDAATDSFMGVDNGGEVNAEAASEQLRAALATLAEVGVGAEAALVARTEQADLVADILANEVDLAPDPEAVEDLRNAEAQADADTWQRAFTDILAQAFGIDPQLGPQLRDALIALDTAQDLPRLAEAVRKGDWWAALRITRRIVAKIVSRAGLSALSERLGEDAYRQILRALARRAVPYLGWGAFALSLALAIWENRERLGNLAD
ncbi:hypothetical protein [Paracoccus spongiarum]|uniref:DUF2059 domain-containing protein n=1 Tax=Paracoccus spongiarum TaxID=3064387 RepID=A0ABT9JCB8_9RHOB|nr:hypothetical protein [Paracoccus sp. 2205BS29-5]MDP5307461.1 hypothetical protein [Paracoccus sp. 2205BS29-5]